MPPARRRWPPSKRAGRSDLAADELSRVLEGFPRRYLTSVDPAQIYRHVRLARNLGHDEVHLLLDRRSDAWELAVVALDKPHLFSNICGTLAFCGMDILRGSAMTSRSGLVLDLFHFVDGEHFFDRNADGPARFEALLQDVVAGREDIAARLLRKEKGLLHRRTPVRVAPVISVDNDQSPTYTVLELVAQDAPGTPPPGQPRRVGARLRGRPRAHLHGRQPGDRRVPSHSIGRQVAAAGFSRAQGRPRASAP